MALNLFVAAITLWNTAYLDRALTLHPKGGAGGRTTVLKHKGTRHNVR
jgi:TnpA family transposase